MADEALDNVLRPADEAELAAVIADAAAAGRPLELLGGGTKRGLGRPVEAAALLDLSRLSGIVDYEPAELVLTARPGTPLAEIERVVAEARQMLAFEPPHLAPVFGGVADGGTLGGTLACNLSGPRRIKAGAARDHFLGFRAVNGRGEAFKAGGKVVKNVTGYDLCKLVAGSYGTLCALTEVTIKVLPAPEATATLCLFGLAPEDSIAALGEALASPHEVSGAAYAPADVAAPLAIGGDGSCAAIRLEGVAPSVKARAAALADLWGKRGEVAALEGDAARAVWRALGEVRPFHADGASTVLWRLSVPPAAGAKAHAALRAALPSCRLYHDWGGGLIWLEAPAAPDAAAALVRGALAGFGGHATLIRAPAETRAAVDVFEPPDAVLGDVTRRLKQGFDPRGVLNRGRMYDGV
ncbi:MAG: glycolate oxidase subunit GlcE [Alphaproteobacteria bacterium]